MSSAFLDPRAIARLENLSLKARMIVDGALSGLHRSRLHGSSVEFAEHKEYSPGDDIRHIDWKAYGKLDRYYIKQFEQESELHTVLLLDATGSMAYRGDGLGKLEYASYLVAALAYLLIRQRDRVGLVVIGPDDAKAHTISPRAHGAHLHDLLGVIERVNEVGARGTVSLADELDRAAELVGRRRALFVVVSDLFDRGDPAAVMRRMRARGHDLVTFQILDPHELELPFSGLTRFEDLESERHLLVDPDAIRKRYRQALNSFLATVRRDCMRGGVEHRLISTALPLERALLDFLAVRQRRGGKSEQGGSRLRDDGTRAARGTP